MTPDQLSAAVSGIVRDLMAEGLVALGDVPEVRIERPKSRDHGDYATNVALGLSKRASLPPRELAALIAERLAGQAGIASAEVAGPGFVNVRLDTAAQGELARTVVAAGEAWGTGDALAGRVVNF